MSTVDVSVVIPTLNGEKYLAELLDMLRVQEFEGVVEVLVIDSGSHDATLSIVRARPWVRLHEIPQSEFGHGRTRNLGAQLSAGRVVAFLTQDAVPAHEHWLREIVAPLSGAQLERGAVAAVVGKQVPRAHCFPLLKYEIQGTFAAQGGDNTTAVYPQQGDIPATRGFYSDVNSATLRELLLGQIPYQDVSYAEDMAFIQDVFEAGYSKAYAPGAAVVHSNDMTLAEYRMRFFEEIIALRRIGGATARFGRPKMLAHVVLGAFRDSIRIFKDSDYGARKTLYWLLVNPAYHWVRWTSYYRANRTALDDQSTIEAGSLEHYRARRRTSNAAD